MEKETSKMLHLDYVALYGVEIWTFMQYIRNTWKVLNCDAGEGWRR
jgi:hypothetical protein